MRRPCGRRSPLRAAAAAAHLNEEAAGRRQIDPSGTGQPSCRPPARPPIGGIGARGTSSPPCCRRLASCASEYDRPTPACMTMHHCPVTTTHGSAAPRIWNWRPGRVYFLAFLNPSRGQPDPALTARLASLASVSEPAIEFDRFTAPAASWAYLRAVLLPCRPLRPAVATNRLTARGVARTWRSAWPA